MSAQLKTELTGEQRAQALVQITAGLAASGTFAAGYPSAHKNGVQTERLVAAANEVLSKLEETL